jgi:MFS transporter, DHA2 family, multidrug resistance protein
MPALGLSFFALDRVARAPTDATNLGLFAAGMVALVVLVLRQRGRDRPLFPVDLFRLPRFAVPCVVSVSMYAANALGLTALPFVLVGALDMSLIEAGVLISILPLATLLTAPAAGYMIDRFLRGPFSAIGAAITGLGFVLASAAAPAHDTSLIVVAIVLMGVGFALFQNHNAKSMILAAPLRRMGSAGGVQSTVRVIGQMLGPALVGISFHTYGERGALTALTIGFGLTVVGAVMGFLYAWIARHAGKDFGD